MRIAISLAAAALLAATSAEAADLTLLVGGSMQVPFRQVGRTSPIRPATK